MKEEVFWGAGGFLRHKFFLAGCPHPYHDLPALLLLLHVLPILLFLLLFLPLRLAGAGGGSEAGEGFAAVPAQPLGSCLALRDDLQLPLPRQPRSRLWLITGLIYVLVSVFSSPHWVQQMWLFLGFVVHCWMLSCHITLGPLVTQSLGCSSSGTPETVPATSSPLHIFLLY